MQKQLCNSDISSEIELKEDSRPNTRYRIDFQSASANMEHFLSTPRHVTQMALNNIPIDLDRRNISSEQGFRLPRSNQFQEQAIKSTHVTSHKVHLNSEETNNRMSAIKYLQ
jgi:hypothetical protein